MAGRSRQAQSSSSSTGNPAKPLYARELKLIEGHRGSLLVTTHRDVRSPQHSSYRYSLFGKPNYGLHNRYSLAPLPLGFVCDVPAAGAPHSGKKTLRALLVCLTDLLDSLECFNTLQDTSCFKRPGDGQSFTFQPPLSPQIVTADIALVVCDARNPYPSLRSLLEDARGHSSLVSLVMTKLDLVSRDFHPTSHGYIGAMRSLSWIHNVNCILISLESREGTQDLLMYIGMLCDLWQHVYLRQNQ